MSDTSYYEIERVSNSLLGRVEWCLEVGFDKFSVGEVKASPSLFIGSQVHEALETNGESLDKLVVFDESLLEDLTPTEKKFAKMTGDDVVNYCSLYNNKDSRRLEELYLEKEFTDEYYKLYDKHVQPLVDKSFKYQLQFLGNEGKTIVNDIDYITNPRKALDTIKLCYYSIINNEVFQDLITSELFDDIEDLREQEFYYSINGVKCKSKLDRLIVNHTKKTITHIDYKTYNGSIIKNFKKYNISRQFSLYNQAIKNNWDYTIEHYCVAVDTDYGKSEVISISSNSIYSGQKGGYYKPEFYDQYNRLDELDVFMIESDRQWLIHNGVWNENKNQYYRYGWEELIQIIITKNLLDETYYDDGSATTNTL